MIELATWAPNPEVFVDAGPREEVEKASPLGESSPPLIADHALRIEIAEDAKIAVDEQPVDESDFVEPEPIDSIPPSFVEPAAIAPSSVESDELAPSSFVEPAAIAPSSVEPAEIAPSSFVEPEPIDSIPRSFVEPAAIAPSSLDAASIAALSFVEPAAIEPPPPAVHVPGSEDPTEPLEDVVLALRRSASEITRPIRPPSMTLSPAPRARSTSEHAVIVPRALRIESGISVRGLTEEEISQLPPSRIESAPLSPIPIIPLATLFPQLALDRPIESSEPPAPIEAPLTTPRPRRRKSTRRRSAKAQLQQPKALVYLEALIIVAIAAIGVAIAVQALAALQQMLGGVLPPWMNTVGQVLIGGGAALWLREKIEITW